MVMKSCPKAAIPPGGDGILTSTGLLPLPPVLALFPPKLSGLDLPESSGPVHPMVCSEHPRVPRMSWTNPTCQESVRGEAGKMRGQKLKRETFEAWFISQPAANHLPGCGVTFLTRMGQKKIVVWSCWSTLHEARREHLCIFNSVLSCAAELFGCSGIRVTG